MHDPAIPNDDRNEQRGDSLFGSDDTAGASRAISGVRELAGTPKRVSILVGRRRVATLLSAQALELGLAPGAPWTREIEEAALRLERVNRAKEIAMRRLTARAWSRAETAAWLASKGIEPDIVEEAIDRLVEIGLLNDSVVAEQERRLAESKSLSDSALRERIARRGLGVAPERGPESDSARAIELARSELSRRDPSSSDVRGVARRVIGVLARKGYEHHVASEAVLIAMRERGLDVGDEAD